MIDHASIPTRDLEAAIQFYSRVLQPLGYRLLVRRPATAGFGKRYPEFWVNLRADMVTVPETDGHHICLRAPDRAAVEAFHAAALDAGGDSAGEPRDRQGEMTRYFGAFIRDPDGNKIEALTLPPKRT